MSLIFDVETGGLPDDELKALYVEPTYEEFAAGCPSNYKEETKLAKFKEQEGKGFAKFAEKAALSPITGRVLAIGFFSITKNKIKIAEGDEPEVLATFWQQYDAMRKAGRSIIGFNIFGFDLPFLIRRSWVHSVDIPRSAYQPSGRYVNWDKCFVDAIQVWQLGQQWGQVASSLDAVAKCFGHPGKPDGIGGGDFARLYFGTPEERKSAIEYLEGDLRMTALVAERLGLCAGVKKVEAKEVEKVNGEAVAVG